MTFKCGKCSKSYSTKSHLRRHEQSHGDRLFHCPVCSTRFHTQEALRAHEKLHTTSKRYICAECGKQFRTRRQKTVHNWRHSGQKYFSCKMDNCTMSFVTQAELKSHQLQHGTERPYSCTICPRYFNHKRNLADHVARIHTREKPHTCSHCSKTFVSTTELRLHSLVHKPRGAEGDDGIPVFQCSKCAKVFTRSGNLRNHLKQNHEESAQSANRRRFKCSFCAKAYAYKGQLRVHERTHTGEKPYSCSGCERKFTTSSERSVHVRRTHMMNEKYYNCPISDCGKAFSTGSGLSQHKQVHNEQRQRFPCTLCDKTFTSKSYVARHTRIHLNEKPHECRYCDYSSVEAGNVKSHEMSVHHGVRIVRKRRHPRGLNARS